MPWVLSIATGFSHCPAVVNLLLFTRLCVLPINSLVSVKLCQVWCGSEQRSCCRVTDYAWCHCCMVSLWDAV